MGDERPGSDAALAAELVESLVDIGGRELTIVHPRSADDLLDEEAFEHEEFLPYWAELWPSGVELARELASRQLAGARVVELGCGLGIPSIAAALAGATVLATDWSPDAVAAAAANAARNSAVIETAVVSWTDPGVLVDRAPWDLVLAADVLYERRHVEPLLSLLPRLSNTVLLADPARPPATRFLEAAAESWTVEPLRRAGGVSVYAFRAPPPAGGY